MTKQSTKDKQDRHDDAHNDGRPTQYKQGWTEFYKLKFFLTPDVLIPRPETELLVDEVLRCLGSDPSLRNEHTIDLNEGRTLKILDIGTGSGCIAISIAKNLKNVNIIATDISQEAIKVAEKNANFHKVEDKIIFIQSDLLEFIKDYHSELTLSSSDPVSSTGQALIRGSIDSRFRGNDSRIPYIIVANLPYISTARLMLVDPMVSDFEPRLALDGGRDGFELYRKLFSQIKDKNFFPIYLVAEIDDDQGELAILEVKKYFPQVKAEIKKDLSRMDRFLIIKF